MDGLSDEGVVKEKTRISVIRTDSKKSFDSEESESEPYLDCDDCNSDDDDQDEVDEIDGDDDDDVPDDRDSLEFEYEPGISLSSLHFYQTCECQNESESGDKIC